MSQTTTDLEQPAAIVDTAGNVTATASAEVEFAPMDEGGKIDDDDSGVQQQQQHPPTSTIESCESSIADEVGASPHQHSAAATAPASGRSHHNIHHQQQQQPSNSATFSTEAGSAMLPPIAAAAAITLPPSALNNPGSGNVLINSNAMLPQSMLTSPLMSATAAATVMRGSPSMSSSVSGAVGNVRRGPTVSSVMGKQTTTTQSSTVIPNHRAFGGQRNSDAHHHHQQQQQQSQIIMGSTNPALSSNSPYSSNFVTYGGSPTGPSNMLPSGTTPSSLAGGGGTGGTRPLSAQRYNSVHGTYSTSPSYGEPQVLSERVVEHEVRVPRKVIREDIVERVIVVPEKVVHEEVVEDLTTVRQRVVEVAKPIYQERIVEVPEIEIVQRIVEVPEIIVSEKIREVPRYEFQERIIEVPRIIQQERIVEVPDIEYHEVPVERIVEVPEVYEQVVLKQVPVPQYIEKPVPEYVNVEVEEAVFRKIPLPVETTTTVELKVPQIRTRYTRQDIPLYVPRFIEIAMPAELMDPAAIAEAEHYAQQVTLLANQSAASLCEVERLAGALKELDGHYAAMSAQGGDDQCVSSMISNWKDGKFRIAGEFQQESNNEEDDEDQQSAGGVDNERNENIGSSKEDNPDDVKTNNDIDQQRPEGDGGSNLQKETGAADLSNTNNIASAEEGSSCDKIQSVSKNGDSEHVTEESEIAISADELNPAETAEFPVDEQKKEGSEIESSQNVSDPAQAQQVDNLTSHKAPLDVHPTVAP